jgi:pimeloyl-ACP methyl ester carboxylesterase
LKRERADKKDRAMAAAWTRRQVPAGGVAVQLDRAGSGGPPLLVLHHDFGTLERLPAYDALAGRFDVLLPQHPGYGHSERPLWMRGVRDLAVLYRGLLSDLGVERASLLGLGFGGWIAAEMATMAPRDLDRLVLVGPMGIKPPEGDILDQALVSHMDYARAGFHDQAAFDALYGADPSTDQLVEWDLCREMNFRIAWKPYMHSQTLPHLLGAVKAPALVVHGEHDGVVPRSASEVYAARLPDARLEVVPGCGHCVEMEKPAELVRLVTTFCNRG